PLEVSLLERFRIVRWPVVDRHPDHAHLPRRLIVSARTQLCHVAAAVYAGRPAFQNMKERSMPKFSVSRDAAKTIKCDVLAVPVFEQLELGPGAKDAESALGTTLKELTEHVPVLGKPSKQFTGELGDAILVQTLGKLPAKQV